MTDIGEYNPGGKLQYWQETEALRNPDLAKQYVDLLIQEQIIPHPDKATGFVFLSPSANQGMFEYEIADRLNQSITKKPDPPPIFLAADIFGNYQDGQFVPGFWKGFYQDEFDNVIFQKISADANKIPILDNSVDVIWERLGALWHVQNNRATGENLDSTPIVNLLNEYDRVLKSGGVIILDAATQTEGATNSTIDFLEGKFNIPGAQINPYDYKIDLKELGWETQFIGSGRARLAVLRKK